MLINFLEKHNLIRYIVCALCTLEAELRLITDKKLVNLLNTGWLIEWKSGETWEDLNKKKFPVQEVIPKDSFYCEDCVFRSHSKLAECIFGSGHYCLYLRKGDFSYVAPTDLLWDGVKCCRVNESIGEGEIWE